MEQKRRVWDNYEVIGEVRKSDGIKFIVAAATREGFRYVNIREFYLRKKDGVWKPGRDGITLPLVAPLDHGKEFIRPFEDMIEMLVEGARAAASMELMDETKAVWAEPRERKAKATQEQ